jgi:hypothetical protein
MATSCGGQVAQAGTSYSAMPWRWSSMQAGMQGWVVTNIDTCLTHTYTTHVMRAMPCVARRQP